MSSDKDKEQPTLTPLEEKTVSFYGNNITAAWYKLKKSSKSMSLLSPYQITWGYPGLGSQNELSAIRYYRKKAG